MDTLSSEGSATTWDAESFRAQLLTVRTLVSALELGHGVHGSSRLAKTTELASKLTFFWLILSVAAGFAELGTFVKVFSRRTTLFAFFR